MTQPNARPNECQDEGTEPAKLRDVLEAELDHIWRHRHHGRDRNAVAKRLVGLALSGGGIRSATTNLGVLQALARMRILPMVDYLSTVSGGGYIGACVSSLLSWNGSSEALNGDRKAPFTFTPGQQPVFGTERANFPLRAEYLEKVRRPLGAELVAHLRTHGNFLIARWGMLRRETMRSIGNLLTGIVFNVFGFLLTLLAASALYVCLVLGLAPAVHPTFAPETAGGSAATSAATLAPLVARDSSVIRRQQVACVPDTPGCQLSTETALQPPTLWQRFAHNLRVMRDAVIVEWGRTAQPDAHGTIGAWWRVRPSVIQLLLGTLLGGFLLAVFAYWWITRSLNRFLKRTQRRAPELGESEEEAFERRKLWQLGGALIAAALATYVLGIVLRLSMSGQDAPQAQLVLLFLPFALFAGARLGTLLLSLLLLPRSPRWTRRMRSLWGSFQAFSIYGWWLALLFALAPTAVYAVRAYPLTIGLGGITSLVLSRLLTARAAAARPRLALPLGVRNALLGFAVTGVLLCGGLFFAARIVLTRDPGTVAAWTLGVAAVVAIALGFLVDLNKISPHYFYRDRLAETYLLSELPDIWGRLWLYRSAMEMPLTCLHGIAAAGAFAPAAKPWRNNAPYHLISAAINLAGSRDLTRKDRKSGYWLFSKLYCGSVHTGFRRTERYRGGETKLARAIAVSGAAASSAMGRATFFAQAFATTLFNIRLGHWIRNPRYLANLERRERAFWPALLWREVTMSTKETTPLVNLSDGGHTGDNVGIYPLLQRRCKVIIACDAERDSNLSFGSFTEALRHAYVDMGIDVDIDLTLIRPDPTTGYSRSHCAVGRIHYPDRPEQTSYLVYLKSSLTGDEPEPVLNYKVDRPAFPHESTADQFFDDAQFESYRALGVHLAEHTFGRWVSSPAFREAQQRHAPTPYDP